MSGTLPSDQARIRMAITKELGRAMKHTDLAFTNTLYNCVGRADKRCHKAFQALIRARLALKQWGRLR